MAVHLRGVLLPDDLERDLYVSDGRITFTPPADEEIETIAREGFVVPGLVDLHAHLELASPAGEDVPAAERSLASARAQLEAGVLALREPGGIERSSTGIGPHLGLPRTFTAGRFLSTRGAYLPGWAREVTDDELPEAALDELRHSGSWVKVIGDWPVDGRHEPNFSADALAEAVRRVHEAGGRITMHGRHPVAIERAIAAGFDSIEHGTRVPRELLGEMARRGVALVPTMIAIATMPSEASAHREMVGMALEEGVRVLAGTDAGVGPHGMVRREIAALRGAGMSPTDALAAGSWDARRFLGLPGLDEGAPADIAAFGDDPRRDDAPLDAPILIVLDGTVIGAGLPA